MDARLRDSKVALPATGTPPEFPLGEWQGLGSPSGCLLDEPRAATPVVSHLSTHTSAEFYQESLRYTWSRCLEHCN